MPKEKITLTLDAGRLAELRSQVGSRSVSAAVDVGGELMPAETVPSYRAAREVAWGMAEEFTPWWAAHPQYHRAHQHVA